VKIWKVRTDDGWFFYKADTKGKARLEYMDECGARWQESLEDSLLRCPELDGLEPNFLNAMRVGAVTCGYADCGCWMNVGDMGLAHVVGDELFCSPSCAAHVFRVRAS